MYYGVAILHRYTSRCVHFSRQKVKFEKRLSKKLARVFLFSFTFARNDRIYYRLHNFKLAVTLTSILLDAQEKTYNSTECIGIQGTHSVRNGENYIEIQFKKHKQQGYILELYYTCN